MNIVQPSLFDPEATGRQLGHAAAQQAAAHADRVLPDWQARAALLLEEFRRSGVREFRSEEFRAYAGSRGLAEPPDRRSFGAVILRAKRAGLIRHLRYEPVMDRKQHGCPRSVWGWI